MTPQRPAPSRTALVTGATKNIGYAIVEALAEAGVAVAVNGRSPDAVREATAQLAGRGATVLSAPGDVRDEDSVRGMVDRVLGQWGRIDILVNNAGVRCHGRLVDTALRDWQQVVDTVLTGPFLTTRAVLGGMCERRWGRIVNVAGVSGQAGAANRAAVVAAKSGVIGLTKATAMEAAAFGVTVNAVSPGLIDTDRSPSLGDRALAGAHYRAASAEVPVARHGRVDEVAALCAYLCSDAAGYITGQVYGINGGMLM